MSCHWGVKCVTCDSKHWFNDANHREDLMLLLIRHRDALAGLAELVAGAWSASLVVDISTLWGRVDPAWFRDHAGHELRPVDEYGRLLGQCGEGVACACCGVSGNCALDHGHAGECQPTKT